jgi:hypothetical protein
LRLHAGPDQEQARASAAASNPAARRGAIRFVRMQDPVSLLGQRRAGAVPRRRGG